MIVIQISGKHLPEVKSFIHEVGYNRSSKTTRNPKRNKGFLGQGQLTVKGSSNRVLPRF